jgi:hypothetical protein
MSVRRLRSSVHLQLFEECVASYIDYKLEKSFNIHLFSRNDFNNPSSINNWVKNNFIEQYFSEEDMPDDYKLIIGDDYLRSIEVYTYMIDYIHDCREDLYDNIEILGDYNEISILQRYIYFYCITKHMNTLVLRVTEKVNEIRNR